MLQVFYLKKTFVFLLFTVSKTLIFWEEVCSLHANSTALASASVLGGAAHVGESYALLQYAHDDF